MTSARPNLGVVAARGIVKTMAGQGGRLVLQVVALAVLSRLLEPDDFGVVLIVMVIVGLADMFRDFGLSSAAIQAKTLSAAARSNLWWANLGIGIILAAVLWVAAAPLASFNKQPLVQPVAQVLALTFVMNGWATQYRADLNRKLRFGALALIEIIAQAVGTVVGIGMAVAGCGVWAMVGLQLAQAMAALVALVIVGRWWPTWPVRNAGTRKLLNFGWSLLLSQVINYVGTNAEKFVIGRYYGAGPAGLLDRANALLNRPLTQLRSPTTSVAVPVLAKLQESPARFGEFVVRGQVGLGYTLVVALAVAAGAAEPLTRLLLGPKMMAAVPMVTAFAFIGATTTLSYVGYWVFVSLGFTKELFRWTLGTSILRIAIVAATLQFGVVPMLWATSLLPLVAAPLSLIWLGTLTPLPTAKLVWGYFRILSLACAAAAAGWCAQLMLAPVVPYVVPQLILVTGAVLAVYAVVLVVPGFRSDVADVRAFIAVMRHRKVS